MNTSQGFHAFSFFQRLSEEDDFDLDGAFKRQIRTGGEMKCRPLKDKGGMEYSYKNKKGIRWLMLSTKILVRKSKPKKVRGRLVRGRRENTGFTIHGVMAIITPKVLLENNYIAAATAEDIEKVANIFNEEAKKISPVLLEFGRCSITRAEPCLNIDLKELNFPCSPKQMMALIKRGDIPKPFVERKEYDKNAHRMKPADESFYLEGNSANINFYSKSEQLNKIFIHRPNIKDSSHIIRLEVQCKCPKLYSMARNNRNKSKFYKSIENTSHEELLEMAIYNTPNPSIPADIILSNKAAGNILQKYIYKSLRKGGYFTLDGARWMVEKHNFRGDKEDRLLYALEIVNECRGIAKAKSKLQGMDLQNFKRSLKDLDEILVNPVTIPRDWGIKYIPNLLQAYQENAYEVRFITFEEYTAKKYLAEYLGHIERNQNSR